MRQFEKMFRVIVAGGIALATPATTSELVGCGGTTASVPGDGDGGGAGGGGFPAEGPVAGGGGGGGGGGGFPQEGAGGGGDPYDANFPQEGPAVFPDAGVDAEPLDAADAADAPCFPQETALPLDSGCT
jgi:hypothetical protein